MNPLRRRTLAVLSAALLAMASSCVSASIHTPSDPLVATEIASNWQVLPYHVAIIPLRSDDVEVFAAPSEKEAQIDFLSGIDTGESNDITHQIVRVLRNNIFSQVTILPAPPQDISPEYLDVYWASAATEAGADLLIDFDSLTYSESVRSKARAISYLLYFTGPLELLFPDRSYRALETTLAVTLFDGTRLGLPSNVQHTSDLAGVANASTQTSQALQLRGFNLREQAHTVRQFRLQPDPVALHYADRLPKGSSGALRFWKSMLIPSAWLETRTDRVAEDLSARFALGLANDLAREIVEGDHEFILQQDSSLMGYRYDARGALIRMEGDYLTLTDRIEIRAQNGGVGDGFITYAGQQYHLEMLADGQDPDSVAGPGVAAIRLSPLQEAPGSDYSMQIFVPVKLGGQKVREASFGIPGRNRHIRLQLVDGARSDRSQAWTHPLPDQVQAQNARFLEDNGVGVMEANE